MQNRNRAKRADRKVEIRVPQKGEKIKLVEMAENNAKITLDNKKKSNKNVIVDLSTATGLKSILSSVSEALA